MLKHSLLLLLLASTSVVANSRMGNVCFGENLAKPHSEHTARLYLKINDSDKLYFNKPYQGPVLDNLDLTKDYIVKVYFDDQVGSSWNLNFSKLGAQSVIIWRSAGSWRMKPVEPGKCK